MRSDHQITVIKLTATMDKLIQEYCYIDLRGKSQISVNMRMVEDLTSYDSSTSIQDFYFKFGWKRLIDLNISEDIILTGFPSLQTDLRLRFNYYSTDRIKISYFPKILQNMQNQGELNVYNLCIEARISEAISIS